MKIDLGKLSNAFIGLKLKSKYLIFRKLDFAKLLSEVILL